MQSLTYPKKRVYLLGNSLDLKAKPKPKHNSSSGWCIASGVVAYSLCMDFSGARREQCYFCLVCLLQGLSLALGKCSEGPLSPSLTTEANRRTNTTGWLSKMDSHGFAGPIKILTECCKMVSSGQLLTSAWMVKAIIRWACQGLTALTAGCSRGGEGRAFTAAALQGGAELRTGSPHPPTPAELQEAVRRANGKAGPYFIPAVII